jgi:hypothetical protein
MRAEAHSLGRRLYESADRFPFRIQTFQQSNSLKEAEAARFTLQSLERGFL